MNAHPVTRWHGWCDCLPAAAGETSAHFALHAVRRNDSAEGLAHQLADRQGIHGTRNGESVRRYSRVLEAALAQFLAQGWTRPPANREGRHPVYVYAVDDVEEGYAPGYACMDEIAFVDEHGRIERVIPTLSLPSRSHEPTRAAEEEMMAAAAVHELSHLMRAAHLPYRRLQNGSPRSVNSAWASTWLWLDEGLAVAAEAELLPGNPSWLAFALNWVDRPERSLVDPRMAYQAALFVRYVARRMARLHPNFLVEVWKKSRFVWTPAENPQGANRVSALIALRESLHDQGLIFCSPDQPDLFASGYCFDNFFGNWPEGAGYEPDVFDRYGQRAITRTWRLTWGQERNHDGPAPYQLPPLACRYFRYIPAEGTGRLNVRANVVSGHDLKMEVVLVERGNGHPLAGTRRVARRNQGAQGETLDVTIDGFSADRCDYALAVVTNCDVNSVERPSIGLSERAANAEFVLNARWA